MEMLKKWFPIITREDKSFCSIKTVVAKQTNKKTTKTLKGTIFSISQQRSSLQV
jgi:hypothetical protein